MMFRFHSLRLASDVQFHASQNGFSTAGLEESLATHRLPSKLPPHT